MIENLTKCRETSTSPACKLGFEGAAHCIEARQVQRHSKTFETNGPDMKFHELEKIREEDGAEGILSALHPGAYLHKTYATKGYKADLKTLSHKHVILEVTRLT